MSTFVFDIGGTSMRMALADGAELVDVLKIPTPQEPVSAVEVIRAFLAERNARPDTIAGGVAGIIRDGVVIDSPHLPVWNGFDLGRALTDAISVPVAIHNDAEIGALGEALIGAGKDYSLVAYITIGTGVGGALVSNGVIAPHAEGFEPGKQIIEYSSERTLEDLVSGAALKKETGQPSETLPRAFYDERTKALATGIYNAIQHWSPEIVILNGSLMNEETAFRIDDIRHALSDVAEGASMPPIALAVLGDKSGLYGALASVQGS